MSARNRTRLVLSSLALVAMVGCAQPRSATFPATYVVVGLCDFVPAGVPTVEVDCITRDEYLHPDPWPVRPAPVPRSAEQ